MKKVFCFFASLALVGCSHTMQRQYFPPEASKSPHAAVVLNMITTNRYQSFVKHVDGIRVGDIMYGTALIHEINLEPGEHTLDVIVAFIDGKQPVFGGNVSCNFKADHFYTIDPVEYPSNRQQFDSGNKISVACHEYLSKPANDYLERLERDRGMKLSNEFFEPDRR